MILINDQGTFKLKQATYYGKPLTGWFVSEYGFLFNPETDQYKFGKDNVANKDLHQRVSIKRRQYYLHRIVAEAFVPNPNNFKIVRHIDDNPRNNYYLNLKWERIKKIQWML